MEQIHQFKKGEISMATFIDVEAHPRNNLLIHSTKTSGQIADVIDHTGTNPYPNAHIGCDIFKTQSIYSGSTATFDTYIRNKIELNVGGYYYAYGYEGTTYQSATCRVPLSQCNVGNMSKRRACVSIGIGTTGSKYSFVDVGLCNDGNGWAPTCWCRGFFDEYGAVKSGNKLYRAGDIAIHASGTDPFTILNGTDPVTIKVEAGTTDKLDYVRVEYTYQGKTGSIAFDVPKGDMHTLVNGKPKVRFYRFMSLIPRKSQNEDGTSNDDADRSGLSAVMDNLKLGTVNWTADKVQHAYSAQYQNIPDLRISNIRSSTIGTNADYAHIYHTVQTH